MDFLLVIAKILILLSGIMFTGVIVERLIFHKYEANLYASFILGVSIIYTFALLGLKLSHIIIFIYAINLIGFYKFSKILFKINIDKYLLLFSFPIMIAISFQMVWYWDAVVNWFFHAKVIAYANKFPMANPSELLQFNQLLSAIFSSPAAHPGYPKMLSVLSALVSEITSVHNEALPKSSMLYLLFGVILGFSEVNFFNNKEKRFIFFILFGLIGIHSYSGYLDGWLAIYTTICCIFIVNLKKVNNERDAANAICTIGFLPMMKLEGTLIALLLLIFLLISHYKLLIKNNNNFIKLSVVLLAPTGIWNYIQYKEDLIFTAHVQPFDEILIERLFHRLEFDLGNIIYHTTVYSTLIYMISMTLFVLILITLKKFSIRNYVWFPLIISLIYLICVIGIFLVSPADLNAMLDDTTRRITMPIMTMIFICNLMILKEMKVLNNIVNKNA